MKSGDKAERVLSIYSKLIGGAVVNKTEEARRYGVNERSVQRDIEDVRAFLAEESANGSLNTVVYDRAQKGYRLERVYDVMLSRGEILAICKILLDSRALKKEEMTGVLSKLIRGCVPKTEQKDVSELIRNEEHHYIEPRHGVSVTDKLWDLGSAVREHNFVEISYQRSKDKATVKRKIKPVALMF